MYIFKIIYLYWIFAANFMRNICHLNIHILVLNISCQQWGEECKFKVIYLYWIYSANNWGNICQLNVYYMLVLDISCQHLGDEYKLGRFLYYILLKLHICIGYMLPTTWGTYLS